MILNSMLERQCSFNTELKTTKIVFTVMAVFIVLWTPYVVVYMASTKTDSIPPGVFKVCGILAAMHSMCNPIIYFTMNRNFRRTVVNLLRKIFPRFFPADDELATTSYTVSNERVGIFQKTRNTLHIKEDLR